MFFDRQMQTGSKLRAIEDHNYRLCSRADAQRCHYRQQCIQKAALYTMNISTASTESVNNQLSIFSTNAFILVT